MQPSIWKNCFVALAIAARVGLCAPTGVEVDASLASKPPIKPTRPVHKPANGHPKVNALNAPPNINTRKIECGWAKVSNSTGLPEFILRADNWPRVRQISESKDLALEYERALIDEGCRTLYATQEMSYDRHSDHALQFFPYFWSTSTRSEQERCMKVVLEQLEADEDLCDHPTDVDVMDKKWQRFPSFGTAPGVPE